MPKYYITCLDCKTVVEGKNSLDACVKAMNKMSMATVGINWIASERGFGKHEDDEVIPDYEIISESLRRQEGA